MSVATVNVKEKKCATCSYWMGQRTLKFSGKSPNIIQADAVAYGCMIQNDKKSTPASSCMRWRLWEKIG